MCAFETMRLSTTCPPLPVPAHPSQAPSSMAASFKLSRNIPVGRTQCSLDVLSYAECLGHLSICSASSDTQLSQSKRLSTILDAGPSTCRSVGPRSQSTVVFISVSTTPTCLCSSPPRPAELGIPSSSSPLPSSKKLAGLSQSSLDKISSTDDPGPHLVRPNHTSVHFVFENDVRVRLHLYLSAFRL